MLHSESRLTGPRTPLLKKKKTLDGATVGNDASNGVNQHHGGTRSAKKLRGYDASGETGPFTSKASHAFSIYLTTACVPITTDFPPPVEKHEKGGEARQ